jgi:hypothetical protein
MFNLLCYYLNFIHPSVPAALRRLAYTVLPRRAWQYDSPKAGYVGGVDTALGTVAFEDECGVLTFVW